MKTTPKLLLFSLIVLGVMPKLMGQTIEVKSLANSTINSKVEIKLSKPKIELSNVTILCKKLSIKNTVLELNTTGHVKFVCEELEIENQNGANQLTLKDNTGELVIEYLTISRPTTREILAENNDKFKFSLLKKR